ncbi:MAG: hypothetical protein UV19_C0002G0055 [Parcubacteria group bacterium GW2011_GWA2_42_28]|nr:MAG: hypothetical protein UV19_C0002G0055 [Parcubacteria group bacterium GW2011_GWA2_42_28]KKT55923.1 MAG: hypothetical protein UW45_C0003G0056 [Parcubacteria group bacterium GW2011_GWC2_44_22]OGY74535.1 MAG: hypothetical protein A2240_03020 [Candidatus Jacksonbacteria bacterium RIFOXYA2_FULL_43_12]
MSKSTLTISQAAQALGVSVQTLRRWDQSGHLSAIRSGQRAHRHYRRIDIDFLLCPLFKVAWKWMLDNPVDPVSEYYCPDSMIFKARLSKLPLALTNQPALAEVVPLIVAITGEIGNNSFDHNLGNWPDILGTFFGYDINKRYIVLADRGQGILQTLKRIRPELQNDRQALVVAFSEIISGRSPEARGNGLKFVRQVVTTNPMSLFFQSGNAQLWLKEHEATLEIINSETYLRGCLALIKF